MNLRRLYNIIVSPHRTARSYGFGVHSPFAYRFVREVLSQPCAYYAYPRLDVLARRDGMEPRVVRALFRVALSMRPGCVEVRGGAPESVAEALRIAGGESNGFCTKAVLGVSDGLSEVAEAWLRSKRGMLFSAPEMAVFVMSDNLPKQRFDIILP